MAAMHGVMARTAVITSDSRGPIVNIIGWIAMVITCLSVITVLVSKYIILRKLSWNDLLLTFAGRRANSTPFICWASCARAAR